MNIEELFAGVGLVIDDQVLNTTSHDAIINIVDELEKEGFPLLKYADIPTVNFYQWKNLSFILLDWELVSVLDDEGYPVNGLTEAKEQSIQDIIEFIRSIISNFYLPIFIFSNSGTRDIIKRLKRENIDIKKDNLPIFVNHKANLVKGEHNVISSIQEWVNNMPAVYVLKEWSNAVDIAKNKSFMELAPTKSWPQILWQNAIDDSVSPIEQISEVLTQNIMNKVCLNIEEEQISEDGENTFSKDDVLNVLRSQRFNSMPDVSHSHLGDFYKIDGELYVNIRPACDCVDRGESNLAYLISCSQLTNRKAGELFNKYGNFDETSNEAILGPLYKNKYYRFLFKDLSIKVYDDIKNFKIGRILPPFIRHITEKYGLYIQRQGLPRLPNIAVLTEGQIAAEEVLQDDPV